MHKRLNVSLTREVVTWLANRRQRDRPHNA